MKRKVKKKKNPKDEDLLKQIKIKREKDKLNNSIIRYDVYYYNEVIGYSFFDKNRRPYYLDLIYIEPEFRRKGVAEFLTSFIEEDQQIKLKASPNMNKDGEAFWNNYNLRKNPRDEELLNQIVIKRIYSPLSLEENFQAYGIFTNISNMSEKSFLHEFANIFELNITNFSKLIGLAIYDKEENHINNVYIHSNFRRKGLATYLYDYIEQDQNIKLKPNNKQLTAGKAFWANRLNK